jgi:flavin-dependent dehydrogenase
LARVLRWKLLFYLINKKTVTSQADSNTIGEKPLAHQEYKKHKHEEYDVAIAGGGLAGMALSIQLARQGYHVIVFEKEQYPFHKVCGEYISYESWDFLQDLGIDLPAMDVSHITRLRVSAPNGKMLEQDLPLGGFGLSRYVLDNTLATIARSAGVTIEENTKVNDIAFDGEGFVVTTIKKNYRSRVACGSYGKRSNIDVKWRRKFTTIAKNKLNNYVAVKYHIRTTFPNDTIALHNFYNGYCGISKIEGDKYCLCYLTNAENLQRCKGSIPLMEETILMKNPHLKEILSESEILFNAPLTISQISFNRKNQVEAHVLMIGDAAGMITPLCGNGMSMALHASKLAAEQITLFLQGQFTRQQMEEQYTRLWRQHFAGRLKMGRMIQRLFGRSWLTNSFVAVAKASPRFVNFLVRRTHGAAF